MYKAFSIQLRECRESGNLFTVTVPEEKWKGLACAKYKTTCSSKVCLAERNGENSNGITDPKQIEDGDTLRLMSDQECILQRCCGCGLWHEILVDRKKSGDILFKFNRIKGEPDLEKYNHTGTDIIKP